MVPTAHAFLLAWAVGVAPAGRAGPRQAPAAKQAPQPPVLTAFTINGGASSVSGGDSTITLTHTVVGTHPTQYRASRRPDFAGAQWQAYVPAPSVRDWYDSGGESCDASRPSHRVVYYLQVRAPLGTELRVADGQRRLVPATVESNVLRATICAYAPAPPAKRTARARPLTTPPAARYSMQSARGMSGP